MVITDQGSGDNTDFILSEHAFSKMAQTTDAAASLRSLGVVDIEYQRYVTIHYIISNAIDMENASCNYSGKKTACKSSF